jgi:hypothetical protein
VRHNDVNNERAFVDSVFRGRRMQKKVTGQQVEKVFPQAVTRMTDVVPDTYQKATMKDGWVTLAPNLKKGEPVRLIGEKQEGVHEVLEVAEASFARDVNDARSVNYEAISMLNVLATQELARRLEKLEEREANAGKPQEKDSEVKALQEENAALRSQLAEWEKRLAGIEALLSSDKSGASTASLKKTN